MRKTLSIDLRERILISYDKGEETREQIAHRFRVSVGMVKKLLQQRRHTGDIAAQHHRAGRKPLIVAAHQRRLRTLLAKRGDLTLKELRAALDLKCSLQAIHATLAKMGLTYKKRRSMPAKKTARKSRGRGAVANSVSTRTG